MKQVTGDGVADVSVAYVVLSQEAVIVWWGRTSKCS